MRDASSYSFKRKSGDVFDPASIDGKAIPIPAAIGSTYWAILKVMFEHPNQRVYMNKLANEVAAVLCDRDDEGWSSFEKKLDARPWQDRLRMSVKLLTRTSGNHPYGLRVREQGLLLRAATDDQGRLYFKLTRVCETESERAAKDPAACAEGSA